MLLVKFGLIVVLLLTFLVAISYVAKVTLQTLAGNRMSKEEYFYIGFAIIILFFDWVLLSIIAIF